MARHIAATLIETLVQRAQGEDALSSDVWNRPDATAWAAVGLRAHGEAHDLVGRLGNELAERQQPDGSIPLSQATPEAWWPTPLALLGWRTDPQYAGNRASAVDFLLQNRGAIIEDQPDILGHDTTLHGWPWIGHTHSWVEPTSLVLLALFSEGLNEHPAVREGVKMLRNRMLEDGGWNYGNTMVYGSVLLPMPECTGIALCAMRNQLSEEEAQKSLDYLEHEYGQLRTPLSLAWAIMGLSAYGRRPKDAEARVSESYALQKRYGPYETALIGLLAACLTDFPFELQGGGT